MAAVFNFFSKRQKQNSGQTEVYVYNQIPGPLRVQIVYILTDLVGRPNVGGSPADKIYNIIVHTLCREYGRIQLAKGVIGGEQLFNFITHTNDPFEILDAIETSFHYAAIARVQYINYEYHAETRLSVEDAANELNSRFREAAAGYQYESGHMMRVDSQFIHAEVVKPVLVLLSDPRYKGAQEEFLNAHKHYREGHHKECVTESLKAFESTMKTICEIRQWTYKKTDTAKTLIDICLKNGLIPVMLQAQLNALQTLLESGVPTLRNKMSGHGQGVAPTIVSQHLAAYTLHLTAANIILLVNA